MGVYGDLLSLGDSHTKKHYKAVNCLLLLASEPLQICISLVTTKQTGCLLVAAMKLALTQILFHIAHDKYQHVSIVKQKLRCLFAC